jgi:hypothetical protein
VIDCGAHYILWIGGLAVARRNLTVQLDEETIRQAKILAAERGTSVSGLVARELEQLVAQNARYQEARRRAIELMEESAPRAEGPGSGMISTRSSGSCPNAR